MKDSETIQGGRLIKSRFLLKSIRATLFLFTLLAVSDRLFAQAGATGTILGTVTDNTGAIIPNAKVKVTNTGTGAVVNMTTSSSGDFNASSLNPGSYSVSVEMAGFQKSVTTPFSLAVDQKIRVNLELKAGAVTETVQVTAQAVTLDTDSSAIGQLVSQKQVEQLPLNGRNFMQLLLLGAGAVTVGGEQGTMRQGVGNAVSINGARPESNNYTLDGLINTDTALVTPAVVLSQDAIQEFKVQSGTTRLSLDSARTRSTLSARAARTLSTEHSSSLSVTMRLMRGRLQRLRITAQVCLLSTPKSVRTSLDSLQPVRSIFLSSTTGATRPSGWRTMKAGASSTALMNRQLFQTQRF